MEALNVAVLPGTARLNVERFNLILMEPSLDFTGDKLRAIVASNMLRDAIGVTERDLRIGPARV